MSSRRVTAYDVANLAGVSQSTVSRTFSASDQVTPETREKVLEAARELGYKPNAIARSLTTDRTNIIGIVMAYISSPFYPYVLEKFIERLDEMGRQVLLFTAARDQEVDDILPMVLEYRVDGLIITSATISSDMADECARDGTPVMLFNRYVPGANASAVCCDNYAGGRLVAEALLKAGCTRLAYIAGLDNATTNRDREQGFRERLEEAGITDWLREQGKFNYESGYDAATRLLRRDDRPDGIFAADDTSAIGAIDAVRGLGLHVPDDVSVIGFDDIPSAAWSSHSLTTIRQPVNRMIDRTLEILMERVESPELAPVSEFLPVQLIERNSARIPQTETELDIVRDERRQ